MVVMVLGFRPRGALSSRSRVRERKRRRSRSDFSRTCAVGIRGTQKAKKGESESERERERERERDNDERKPQEKGDERGRKGVLGGLGSVTFGGVKRCLQGSVGIFEGVQSRRPGRGVWGVTRTASRVAGTRTRGAVQKDRSRPTLFNTPFPPVRRGRGTEGRVGQDRERSCNRAAGRTSPPSFRFGSPPRSRPVYPPPNERHDVPPRGRLQGHQDGRDPPGRANTVHDAEWKGGGAASLWKACILRRQPKPRSAVSCS